MTDTDIPSPIVTIAGAAPDTGNLGVTALFRSVLDGVARRLPSASIVVLDHGRGVRLAAEPMIGADARHWRCGAIHTRRLYRPECMERAWLGTRLGVGGGPVGRLIARSTAVLDISGGDSFSDLYGAKRFRGVALPKLLALRVGTPLVFLPQTYGPFSTDRARRTASDLVGRAEHAWARDERSFQALRELLGVSFDPARHRVGVDVAFALAPSPPPTPPEPIRSWIDDNVEIAGLNISGLILNSSAAASTYGLVTDYGAAVREILDRFLRRTSARILLVPHVAPTHAAFPESDAQACREIAGAVSSADRDRVVVAPTYDDPRCIKHLIARCSWFCGTRMHSTIAALSSGVPTATLAYSLKAQGVFDRCGQGEHVADMRRETTPDAIECVWRSWETRDDARRSLRDRIGEVRDAAEEQMDAIAGLIDPEWREQTRSTALPATERPVVNATG